MTGVTDTSRRSFLKLTAGAAVIIAAPAIVRASSLMKVKPLPPLYSVNEYLTCKHAWYMIDGKIIVPQGRFRMRQFREQLWDGLYAATEGLYDDTPEQWDKLFKASA